MLVVIPNIAPSLGRPGFDSHGQPRSEAFAISHRVARDTGNGNMKASDLQLNAHEIPNAGLTLAGELPAEWVAESLLPAYTTSSPITLSIEVLPVAENVLAKGRLKIRLDFECSRTLAPASIDLDTTFTELFTPGQKHMVNLAEEDISSDDLADEPWIIDNGVIDLEALVREHLVLGQDPYPVAPGANGAPSDAPLWSSTLDGVDPRWERLKNLKLD